MYSINQTKTNRYCVPPLLALFDLTDLVTQSVMLALYINNTIRIVWCDCYDMTFLLLLLLYAVKSIKTCSDPLLTPCVLLSISMKELKALLPMLNFKAPSSRTLKDRFQVPFFFFLNVPSSMSQRFCCCCVSDSMCVSLKVLFVYIYCTLQRVFLKSFF